jgi:hypothetical protein
MVVVTWDIEYERTTKDTHFKFTHVLQQSRRKLRFHMDVCHEQEEVLLTCLSQTMTRGL